MVICVRAMSDGADPQMWANSGGSSSSEILTAAGQGAQRRVFQGWGYQAGSGPQNAWASSAGVNETLNRWVQRAAAWHGAQMTYTLAEVTADPTILDEVEGELRSLRYRLK